MFFEVEHEFDAPVDAVAAAMFHPEYHAYLLAHQDVLDGVQEQSREEDAQSIRRRVHYRPRPAFDHIGPKKVPPEWFEFVEESTWDKAARRLTFDNVPCTSKVAFRFTNRGSIQLAELAAGKTVRRAQAEVKLQNLPFMLRPMGAIAEQMISREARKLLETEAQVLGRWLAERA